MNINQRVRFAILNSGKNQAELAKMVGVSPPAMYKYINGISKPIDKVLEKLAEASGFPYDWLKTGSGIEPLGFKDFIRSTGLTKEELIKKVEDLENEVEKRDLKLSTLKKEIQAQKREIELLERLTAKGRVEVP